MHAGQGRGTRRLASTATETQRRQETDGFGASAPPDELALRFWSGKFLSRQGSMMKDHEGYVKHLLHPGSSDSSTYKQAQGSEKTL